MALAGGWASGSGGGSCKRPLIAETRDVPTPDSPHEQHPGSSPRLPHEIGVAQAVRDQRTTHDPGEGIEHDAAEDLEERIVRAALRRARCKPTAADGEPVLRITETPWSRHEHDEVPARLWQGPGAIAFRLVWGLVGPRHTN